MELQYLPAAQFSLEQLTDVYNQARQNYMIPMPMTTDELIHYIHVYDIDLEQSIVVVHDQQLVSIGMLGIRECGSWVTRLGTLASHRGLGIGQAVVEKLLQNSDNLGIKQNFLEVIAGNHAAQHIFEKLGFKQIRELCVLRKEPGLPSQSPSTQSITPLKPSQFLALLQKRALPAWTNQTETFTHLDNVSGFEIVHPEIGSGWLIYQLHNTTIPYLVFGSTSKEPSRALYHLLTYLNTTHPQASQYIQNIPSDDPHLQAFYQIGYQDDFRRIEMYRFPEDINV